MNLETILFSASATFAALLVLDLLGKVLSRGTP